MIEIVPLTYAHLQNFDLPDGLDTRAYFTPGSVARCVLDDGVPVFCGGIVNMEWMRGEAWILPTPYFRSHLKSSLRIMRDAIPGMARSHHFHRVQATCVENISASLFRVLGFRFEGTLAKFGPHGETCDLYSRIFEVTP